MPKFEIDGKEIDIETLECDTIVIARPTQQLDFTGMRLFAESIENMQESFSNYGITLIAANYGDITFEVITAKAKDMYEEPEVEEWECSCGTVNLGDRCRYCNERAWR